MADEDKEKTAGKVAKKKAAKKKTVKKKVVSKKKAAKKTVSKKVASGKADVQKNDAGSQKSGVKATTSEGVKSAESVKPVVAKPVAVATSSSPSSSSAKPQATASRANPVATAISTAGNKITTGEKSPGVQNDPSNESAVWWLNLALALVIAAIAALLYTMMQFGELKGMDMDKIWSYFGHHDGPVVEQAAQPTAVPAQAEVVVVETEVIEAVIPVKETGKNTEPVMLRPLPQDQQNLLWEALMQTPENQ